MRIAMTGASGTGKTTLAEWIASTYKLPFNPVGARSVAKAMGFDSPYDVDKFGKREEFQRRLIIEKLAWEVDHETFVTDRTPFDNLAYTALHDVAAVDSQLMAQAHRGARRYTHVLFCSIDAFFNLGDDPARVKDFTYHELFETLTFGLVARHTQGRRQHHMHGGTLADRCEEVRQILTPSGE